MARPSQEDPKYVSFRTESYVNVYRPFGIFQGQSQNAVWLSTTVNSLRWHSRYHKKGKIMAHEKIGWVSFLCVRPLWCGHWSLGGGKCLPNTSTFHKSFTICGCKMVKQEKCLFFWMKNKQDNLTCLRGILEFELEPESAFLCRALPDPPWSSPIASQDAVFPSVWEYAGIQVSSYSAESLNMLITTCFHYLKSGLV